MIRLKFDTYLDTYLDAYLKIADKTSCIFSEKNTHVGLTILKNSKKKEHSTC